MKLPFRAWMGLSFQVVLVFAALDSPAADPLPGARSMDEKVPFWNSRIMDGNSLLFIRDPSGHCARGSLLFVPSRIISVKSSSGETVYREGIDYEWEKGSREIVLPPGSRIVSSGAQDLRRLAGSQPYALTYRDGNGEILFGGMHEYHDLQTVIRYLHDDTWSGPVPSFAGPLLPRTIQQLSEGNPLVIALFGDSISTGCNVSGWARVAPFQPPYQDLLVEGL